MSKKTIKEKFKGYTLYSKKEIDEIINDSIIVLDTNILLNVYRYSPDTRNYMFDILKKHKSNIWIPYFVAKEYFKNRDIVIKESEDINNIKSDFNSDLLKFKEHFNRYKNKNSYVAKMESKISELDELINGIKYEGDDYSIIEDKLLDIIGNSIGDEYCDVDLKNIIQEGQERIEKKLPPGYKDDDKSEFMFDCKVNGDYIIFKSFMDYSKEKSKNIIFITDDVKEDWFHIVKGEKLRGRMELLNEFYNETGKLLIITSFDYFVKKYHSDVKVSEDTLDEIKDIRDKINNYSDYYINSSDIRNLIRIFSSLTSDIDKDSYLDIIKRRLKKRMLTYKDCDLALHYIKKYLSNDEFEEYYNELFAFISNEKREIDKEYSIKSSLDKYGL